MTEEVEEVTEVTEEAIENIESQEEEKEGVASEEDASQEEDDAPEGETSEEEVVETVTLDQKIAEVFPERTFDNDADKHTALMQYVGQLEAYVEKGKQANEVLNARMMEDEEFRGFLTDIVGEGLPFRLAIAKNFTPDDLFPKEGEPDYEALQEIRIEQKKRAKEQRALQIALRENSNASATEIAEFVKENEFTEQNAAGFFSSIDGIISDLSQFKITKKTLEIFKKGLAFDEEVKNAAKIAELKVANQKIGKAIKGTVPSDGLPNLKPSADSVENEMPKQAASKWVGAVKAHLGK